MTIFGTSQTFAVQQIKCVQTDALQGTYGVLAYTQCLTLFYYECQVNACHHKIDHMCYNED